MRSVRGAGRLGLALIAVLSVLGLSTAVYAAVAKDFTMALSSSSASVQQGTSATTTVTAASVNGYVGTVALSASGLPSGATATLQPSSVALTSTATSGRSTLTVQTAKTTPAGTYRVQVNGASGSLKRSVTFTLTVNYALNGSFALSAAPSAGSVTPGGTAATVVTLSRTSPFTGAVAMSTYGSLPAGVTTTFTPTTIESGSTTSTLQITTTSATPPGTIALYLVGTYTDAATAQKYYQYAQTSLTVTTGGKPFAIATAAGTDLAGLSPGVSKPMNLLLTNPNPQVLDVTNLTVIVSSTSNAGCDPSNFEVTQFARYPLTMASNQSASLVQMGVAAADLPRLKMLNLPRNQDACKNATLKLAYSGTAQGT